jgi:hypothetical protein
LRPNQKLSLNFVAQRLPEGRWIRVLTVADQFAREFVTMLADKRLSGEKVAVERAHWNSSLVTSQY